jgi:hypothetical protein
MFESVCLSAYARPICCACSAESQKTYSSARRPPSHLAVVAKSRSNALPVGAITFPSGVVISPLNVPVQRVTNSDPVAVSELDRTRVVVDMNIREGMEAAKWLQES